jgi:MerR family transcriptional regulator, light-induced transcriptional regulator
MIIYSIKDIENLSGVKAHTIRMWERRFDIIKSKRTDTNIRFYDEKDLQLILNIALLNRKGHKISRIAQMTAEEIQLQVASLLEVETEFEDKLDVLTLAMFELNEYKFVKILSHQIKEKGFEETLETILYPLLDKLSMMWITGSVKSVHETFVSNIIRRKLMVEMDQLPYNENEYHPRVMVYLPENDTHELSLLYLNYVLRKYGANTLNLGINVSLIDVLEAAQILHPQYVYTIFNDSFTERPLQPYLNELAKYLPETQIIISGYQTLRQKLILPSNVEKLADLKEIKKHILIEMAVEDIKEAR